jgi:pimeloyl-ACP methyl ester carboxylesterase
MSRRRKLLFFSVGLLLLGVLISSWRVEIPIQTIFYGSGIGQTDELIIFFPGIGDEMDIFERAGFIDLLRESPRSADSVVVDARIGYYWNGSLPERVHQDILVPFRERGYKKFILVGISLGGYGGLWLNDEYGDWIDGIVLLSPLLGRESVIEKIMAADDIGSWRLQLDHAPRFEERVWIWIDDMHDPESAKIQSIILGFGTKDKYQKAAELLARSISDAHVFRNNGSHNWVTWRPLWAEIMKSHVWHVLGNTDVEVESMHNKPSPEKEAVGL